MEHVTPDDHKKKKDITAIASVSFVLNALMFFLDESRYSFDFFLNAAEMGVLFIFTVVFACVPLAIYGFVGDKFPSRSFAWAMAGFLPQLGLLSWIGLS